MLSSVLKAGARYRSVGTAIGGLLAVGLGAAALAISASDAVGQEAQSDNALTLERFVLGNSLFLTYHEVAHVLIEDLEVPITGWPEDSADNLATLMMAPDPDDSDSLLLAASAALGWLQDARTAEAAGRRPNFADVHALSEARAQRILCLLAGGEIATNTERKFFVELAKASGGTDSYLKQCAAQSKLIESGWETSLGDHFRGESEEPTADIEVRYDTPPAALEQARQYMESNSVLEIVAGDIRELVHDVSPFTLVARSCKSPDAFWDSKKREVVICYELTDWFIKNPPG
jgi:hypothetical protein